jgi:hypothetical protein
MPLLKRDDVSSFCGGQNSVHNSPLIIIKSRTLPTLSTKDKTLSSKTLISEKNDDTIVKSPSQLLSCTSIGRHSEKCLVDKKIQQIRIIHRQIIRMRINR